MTDRQIKAKNWLNAFYPNYLELESLRERIEILNDDLNRCVGVMDRPDYQANSNGKEHREELLAEVADMYQIFENKSRILKLMDETILSAVMKIDEPIERTLLIYRYIDRNSWKEVSRKIKYERAQTFRIHLKALDDIYDYIEEVAK